MNRKGLNIGKGKPPIIRAESVNRYAAHILEAISQRGIMYESKDKGLKRTKGKR
jgi:hypothetical protein